MRFSINALLEWLPTGKADPAKVNPHVERVLWTDPCHREVLVINLFDRSGREEKLGRYDDRAKLLLRTVAELEAAVDGGQARVLTLDPCRTMISRREQEVKDPQLRRRDLACRALRPMLTEIGLPGLANSRHLGPAVVRAVEVSGFSEPVVRRYLRRYFQGGQIDNALLPLFWLCGGRGKERAAAADGASGKKRGRPRRLDAGKEERAGVNIGPEDLRKFELGLKAFYHKKNGLRLEKAFEKTLGRHYHLGHKLVGGVLVPVLPAAEKLPSFAQFRYHFYKGRDLAATLVKRRGQRRFNLGHRAVLGNSSALGRFGPGSCFQIDSTTADLYLVNSLDRSRLIGRPTLYFIVDVFSRLIVGFCVSVEAPSYAAACLALENANTDKVAYCRQYGIEICAEEWPCANLCESLLADRGELAGQFADGLTRALGFTMSNTPPYRPDLKGIVEQRFRLTNEGLVRWLPGAVHPRRERGDCDHSLDAVYTLDEFRKMMIHFILDHNRERFEGYDLDEFEIADQVEPRPNELWAWGVQNRSGSLHAVDEQTLRLQLLPCAQAPVTLHGIELNGSRYTCARAENEQWFVRARDGGGWRVNLAFHPHHRRVAYLRPGPGMDLEPCVLLDAKDRFRDRDLEEVEDFFLSQEEARTSRLTADRQARLTTTAHLDAITAKAKAATGAALADAAQSRSARKRGLRASRQEEREGERRQREAKFQPAVPDNVVSFPSGSAPGDPFKGGGVPPPKPTQTPDPGGYVAAPLYHDLLEDLRAEQQGNP